MMRSTPTRGPLPACNSHVTCMMGTGTHTDTKPLTQRTLVFDHSPAQILHCPATVYPPPSTLHPERTDLDEAVGPADPEGAVLGGAEDVGRVGLDLVHSVRRVADPALGVSDASEHDLVDACDGESARGERLIQVAPRGKVLHSFRLGQQCRGVNLQCGFVVLVQNVCEWFWYCFSPFRKKVPLSGGERKGKTRNAAGSTSGTLTVVRVEAEHVGEQDVRVLRGLQLEHDGRGGGGAPRGPRRHPHALVRVVAPGVAPRHGACR